MTPKVTFSQNLREDLQKALDIIQPKGIFLVTGESSYTLSGASEKIAPLLHKYPLIKFSNFTENPKISEVENGLKLFQLSNCDTILAVGGGTALDISKLIALFASNSFSPYEWINKIYSFKERKANLVHIPTTSGTGSEATHFAVMYKNMIKYSVEHESLIPDYAFLDPSLTYNLPKKIAASSLMDALCQAIESCWNIHSTKKSMKYSTRAIQLITENSERALLGQSKSAKKALQYASYLAGKAINITKTTAPHAISYTLTSEYGMLHGHAVAVLIPYFFPYNFEVSSDSLKDKRGIEHVKQTINNIGFIFKCNTPQESKQYLFNFMDKIGLGKTFTEIGIQKEMLPEYITQRINPQRMANNPRKVSTEWLKSILHKIGT